jgi:hypothetical protein
MKSSDVERPMEDRFLIELQLMLSDKIDKYQNEFFKRIHGINKYKNRVGCIFNNLAVAAMVAQQMDNEKHWEDLNEYQ